MGAYTAKDTAGTVNPISSDWLGALPRAPTIYLRLYGLRLYKPKKDDLLKE